MLSAGRNRRYPACAPCFEAGSVIVRMGWAASQGSWPGLGLAKCDPSQCPQDLGTQSLCRGTEAVHTGPRPGEAYGCLIGGSGTLYSPAVVPGSRGCPASRQKLVCIRMLGMRPVLAFADLVQRQLWAYCGLHADGDPDLGQACTVGSHLQTPTGLVKLTAV